ncbi:MAG: antibiotic biosynthesis monooxygenase [Acidobacteriaceae bacterium]|nr:antibiotic biosynthesis monooxygenase [Acidobacteriaceae bacterium]
MPYSTQTDENRVIVIARLIAKQGKKEEVLQSLCSFIEPTRNEPGCLCYELNRSIDDSRIFTFVEKFDSDAAFELHERGWA